MTQKPIFPIRLGEDDKKTLEQIKNRYGLVSQSDAVRLSVRYMSFIVNKADFDPDLEDETMRAHMERYEEENPDTLKIVFKDEPEPVPQ